MRSATRNGGPSPSGLSRMWLVKPSGVSDGTISSREIGRQRCSALRLLARTRDGDAAAQIGKEGAVVEMGVRPRDGGSAARGLSHRAQAFRGSCDSTSRAQ